MKRACFAFFALWPFVMFAAVLVMMLGWQFEPPDWFIGAWTAGTVVFAVGWIAFIWDVWHNPRVPAGKRALWTTVLVFAGPYGLPVYFWFYLR